MNKKNAYKKIKRISLGVAEIALLTGLHALEAGLVVATTPMSKMTIGRAIRMADIRAGNNRRAVGSLLRKGLLTIKKTEKKSWLTITPNGKKALEKQIRSSRAVEQHWDGAWRFIMFDIRERSRSVRDAVRYRLQKSGLKRMHDSFWVSPYPVSELANVLKEIIGTEGRLFYGTTHDISVADTLQKMFKV